MESIRNLEPESSRSLAVDDEDDDDNEFGLEVEVEIAELREKIVAQEEYSRKLKQEIGTYILEKEDLRQEMQEREIEMKELDNQLSATRDASTKKMAQKDETITFMQTTMMQIMQEKQELDKKLRGSNLDRTQTELMNGGAKKGAEEDAEEQARLQAINDELRKLDDNNRQLEDELNQFKYNSSLELKEKESVILGLQEELSDLKWEIGAREKGADYITLLKDRKERKNQLNKARKALKDAEEKILELELQNNEMLSNKKDLEKEVDSLTKGALSEEMGEQISGMKRQIKSLKQHNTALERKVEEESRFFQDMLGEKEAKIRILDFELDKHRNPTQHAVRGVVSGFMTGFGRKNDDSNNDNALDNDANNNSKKEDDEAKSTKTANADRREPGGNIWSLFGARGGNRNKQNGNGNVGNGDKESVVRSPDSFEAAETL
jgi:hypothetical protein